MGICEDRITEDSTEFEKAFLKIYDGSLWTALDKMKDWQPPKPREIPVEIPQLVAVWFEDRMLGSFSAVVASYSFNDDEAITWVHDNGGLDLLCKMKLYGYTVEKEQLFYLKNKNTGHILYRQPKEAGGNLIEVVATINEEYTWFTQDEIDTMHIGSYEKIEVEP